MFRQTLLLSVVVFLLISCQQEPKPDVLRVEPEPEIVETAVFDEMLTDYPSRETVRVGVPLGGVIHDQVAAGTIHPDESLVIEFDRALMRNGVSEPLLFEPPVAGTFVWNDEGTKLTFTPDSGFAVGQSYQISQSPDQVTRFGLPLANPLVWNIQTLSALNMASSETQENEAISDDEWLITFPIDFEHEVDWESVEEDFLVEPAVPMKISWWENGNLQQIDLPDETGHVVNSDLDSLPESKQMFVQARVPFDLEQTYRFVLQEWVTDCTCSRVLKEAFVREFALPPLEAEIVRTDITPQIQFNYPLDLDHLLSVMSVTPEFGGDWQIERIRGETVLSLTPNALLPDNGSYDLVFEEPLRHENGTVLSKPDTVSFEVPFVIAETYPSEESGVIFNPRKNIEITFAHEMDEQSVIDAFEIEPDVPGDFSWEDKQMIFHPENGQLAGHTQYTVTLAVSARDSIGRPVFAQPYQLQFETGEAHTDVDFGLGLKVQVVDVNGRRAVQYRSIQTEPISVTFSLYDLEQEQALQILRDAQTADKMLKEVTTWTAVTEPKEPDEYRYINPQETIIPADLPAGPYLMTVDANSFHDELLIFLSEHTLVAKKAGSQVTVWTTEINGEVARGLDVMILDEKGKVLVNGRSSADGLFQVEMEDGPEAAYVMVKDGDDLVAVGLKDGWHSGGYQAYATMKTIINVYTDRPLYNPGDAVHFKAILRSNEDVKMTPPVEGAVVMVRLLDLDGEAVQTLELETNSFGSADGEFELAEGIASGEYRVEVLAPDGRTTYQTFKVDTYQPPAFAVTVTTDAEQYVDGDSVSVTVESTHFSGDPVAEADVEVNVYYYEERRWDRWWSFGEPITGTTDANGRFSVELERGTGHQVIEAVVANGVDQAVSDYKMISVNWVTETLQLDVGDYLKQPDELIQVDVTVENMLGDPVVARGVDLELRHFDPDRREWIESDAFSGETGENGRYTFTFAPTDLGYYHLSARFAEQQDRSIVDEEQFMVYSQAQQASLWYGNIYDLNFIDTEEIFVPGEDAKLFIQSSIAGPALLTLERDTVIWKQVIVLTPPLTVVDVPIPENGAPNLFATIMVWNKLDRPSEYSIQESYIQFSTIELPVSTAQKSLNVEINLEQESYRPGETVSMTMRVTDHAGIPVSAELSLGVVDEAIFGLMPDITRALHDTFYVGRSYGVSNYDALRPARRLSYDLQDSYDGSHCDARGEEGSLLGGTHGDFEDTAAWYPTLHTDENGEVTVSFTLPEAQTDWRIQVRAITVDTKVEEASYLLETE